MALGKPSTLYFLGIQTIVVHFEINLIFMELGIKKRRKTFKVVTEPRNDMDFLVKDENFFNFYLLSKYKMNPKRFPVTCNTFAYMLHSNIPRTKKFRFQVLKIIGIFITYYFK